MIGKYEVPVKKEILKVLLFYLDMTHETYLDKIADMVHLIESDSKIVASDEVELN